MAPKIAPKPQPRRRQADPGTENPRTDGASAFVTAVQAPPPSRPAVTRLESIASGPHTSGTTKVPLKYKPTGIARRTKEEREKAEREEQERLAARAATAPLATDSGRGNEGANRRTRGDLRGGLGGRGRGGGSRGDRLQGGASGPFAGASAAIGTSSLTTPRALAAHTTLPANPIVLTGQKKYFTEGPWRQAAGSSSTSHARDRTKTEQEVTLGQDSSVTVGRAPNIAAEIDDLYKSSSDGEGANEGKRVNIELINLSTNQFSPIRIDRREHINRTTAESPLNFSKSQTETRKRPYDGLFVPEDDTWEKIGNKDRVKDSDLGSIKSDRKWKGVCEDDDVEIKSEASDTDLMAADAPLLMEDAEMTEAPELPEASTTEPLSQTGNPSRRPKILEEPNKSGHSNARPVIRIDEDRGERERYEEDMRALAHELGNVEVVEPPISDTADKDGESSTAPPCDPKGGRLYLFQLPPIIPPLVPLIKPDPVDLPTIVVTAQAISLSQPIQIPPTPRPGEGLIGRMRVHRSGRVTMEWGGPRLEVQKGGDWSFLTDVVATDEAGKEPISCGMGSVKAKFVAVPEWRSLLKR